MATILCASCACGRRVAARDTTAQRCWTRIGGCAHRELSPRLTMGGLTDVVGWPSPPLCKSGHYADTAWLSSRGGMLDDERAGRGSPSAPTGWTSSTSLAKAVGWPCIRLGTRVSCTDIAPVEWQDPARRSGGPGRRSPTARAEFQYKHYFTKVVGWPRRPPRMQAVDAEDAGLKWRGGCSELHALEAVNRRRN